MQVTLERKSGAQFSATNARGQEIILDGPADIGGADAGMRPMELLLVSLAGCSAVDVLHILQKGRLPIEDLKIVVDGTRKDEIPAVFETIRLDFIATGDFPLAKLERAVELSMEKYCSVAKMLAPTVNILATSKMG